MSPPGAEALEVSGPLPKVTWAAQRPRGQPSSTHVDQAGGGGGASGGSGAVGVAVGPRLMFAPVVGVMGVSPPPAHVAQHVAHLRSEQAGIGPDGGASQVSPTRRTN